MLTRPTEKEILALARIAVSGDGKILKDYLVRTLENAKDGLVAADADHMLRRFQGRAEAVKDLVEALEQSPDLVVKLENRAHGR